MSLHRINIRLANYPPIAMNGVTVDDEEVARRAEQQINALWQKWCSRWRNKSGDEVMAMVAFRFAQLYYARIGAAEQTALTLERLDASLGALTSELAKALALISDDSGSPSTAGNGAIAAPDDSLTDMAGDIPGIDGEA